jgi:transposase-like protein
MQNKVLNHLEVFMNFTKNHLMKVTVDNERFKAVCPYCKRYNALVQWDSYSYLCKRCYYIVDMRNIQWIENPVLPILC